MRPAIAIPRLEPSSPKGRETREDAPQGVRLSLIPTLADRQDLLVRNVLALRSAGDLGSAQIHTTELLLTLRPIFRQVVRRLRRRAGSLSADDLEQVAALAAIKSIDKYDPTRRGSQSFGQFVYFRALSSCKECIRLHSADVHVSDAAAKGRTVRQARGEAGAAPRLIIDSLDAATQDTGDTTSQVREERNRLSALRRAQPGSLEDATPESLLANAELQACLREQVLALPQPSRELVSRVYGLDGREPQSVRSLAEEWNAPRSRLDRMLARTLAELRQTLLEARVL